MKKHFYFASFFILILFASVYFYLAKIGETINLDDANVPEILPKADSCSSPYVENEVISLFKINDLFYQYISYKSIDSIIIKSKKTLSSEFQSSVNICSGIIEVKSNNDGFRPVNYDNTNLYNQKIYIEDNDKILKYTYYETPVFYSSQISEGKNYVRLNKIEESKFGCEGFCAPVYKFERKIEPPVLQEEPENTDVKKSAKIKNKENVKKSANKNQENTTKKKSSKFKKMFKFLHKSEKKIT